MERNDVELHALAAEIADLDGLTYGEALAKARRELEGVQQYAHDWNQEVVAPSAPYLDALSMLEQGANLTPEQVLDVIAHDPVVRYLWQHGAALAEHDRIEHSDTQTVIAP